MSERQINQYDEEMEKIDLFHLIYMMWRTLKRNFVIVFALIIVCAAGSGIWTLKSYTPRYQAYTSFVVGSGTAYSSTYVDNTTAEQMGKTFSYILSSGVLRDVVALDLGIESVTSTISASVMSNTNLFTITVEDGSPQVAYDVLQSVIENYPKVAEYVIGATKLTVIDESGLPAVPVNSRQTMRNTVLGAFVGVALSLLFLLIQSIRNKTIQGAEELKKLMNAPSLGSIPIVPVKKRSRAERNVLKIDNARVPSTFKESIRVVRSRVERAMKEREGNVILVTSAIPGEGKSTLAANLALAFAKKNAKVILVDGDLRHPSVMSALGMEAPERGLSHLLKEGGNLGQALVRYGETPLRVLSGSKDEKVENPMQLIQSKKMSRLIDALKKSNDYIIIDTPPSAMLSDVTAYAGVADALILVVRQDFTEQKQVRKALATIADANIPVAGYVLNGVAEGIGNYGYYGGYGYRRYGYGYGHGKSYGYGESAERKDEREV